MSIPGPMLRRAISVPATIATAAVSTALLPALLPTAWMVDGVRDNRFAWFRALLALWVALVFEVWGIGAALALWLGKLALRPSPERWTAWNRRLTAWWGSSIFRWVVFLFDLKVEVRGLDAVRSPGPVLFLMRHAGIIDTLVAPSVMSRLGGRDLRYVVKDGLLWDPCLDIVGARFPNVFVTRGGKDTDRQVAAVKRLAAEMPDEEGLIIYPEGTRFSEAKRNRILEKLRSGNDPEAVARAEQLQRVLPPRRGGSLAVLQGAPDADVVIVGNIGFEWAATRPQLLNGRLIGRTIHVDFRRYAATEVPRDDEGAMAWLNARWIEMDHWVRTNEDRD